MHVRAIISSFMAEMNIFFLLDIGIIHPNSNTTMTIFTRRAPNKLFT